MDFSDRTRKSLRVPSEGIVVRNAVLAAGSVGSLWIDSEHFT